MHTIIKSNKTVEWQTPRRSQDSDPKLKQFALLQYRGLACSKIVLVVSAVYLVPSSIGVACCNSCYLLLVFTTDINHTFRLLKLIFKK